VDKAIQKEEGMSRYGLTVVACLLLAGGLIAGQAGAGRLAMIGASSTLRLPEFVGSNPAGSPSLLVPDTTYDNDVGVSVLVPVPDVYVPFGDTVFPRCEVKNYGVQSQTNIPVVCVVFDTAAGARVYGQTVYVASLDSGSVDTVEFPGWVPPVEENVYFDTMATALPGDEDTTNDWKPGRVTVSEWVQGHLSYNDGTFENAISWLVAGNELAVRFFAPVTPIAVDEAVVWLTTTAGSGIQYDAEVRIYGNDGGGGIPGTMLGKWVGKLNAKLWTSMYKNEISFDPPVVVDYDTFFVSYYQTSITPAYPYLGMDENEPFESNDDWGKYNGTWGFFPCYGDCMDFGIDVHYRGLLIDALLEDITVPQAHMDSNTTFTPRIVVKNTGFMDRNDIPVTFSIVRDSALCDTIYAGSANSGPIQAGQTKVVTFPDSVTPEPGYYTMTSITLLPFDVRPSNDTLVGSLSVSGLGIAAENVDAGRVSVSIAPNPLGKSATVRYSLPKAGPATLDMFDVMGRTVLTQTIAAALSGTATLDLRGFKAGVYLVKVTTEGFGTTQKLVVER
jgi:hypothetical protein